MSFPALELTENGKRLLSNALVGQKLNFSKIAIGSGVMSEDAKKLTELVVLEKDIPISGMQAELGTARLLATLDNTETTEGFWWREIGIYANDENGEVLYAYANAGEYAEYIPAYTSASFVRTTITVNVMVGNAENVTASIADYAGYITFSDFQQHLSSANPHNVTAADVGLRVTNEGILQYLNNGVWRSVATSPSIHLYMSDHSEFESVSVSLYNTYVDEGMDDTTFIETIEKPVIDGAASVRFFVPQLGVYRVVITCNYKVEGEAPFVVKKNVVVDDAMSYSEQMT
ncbi:MAG: phage tail protein [Clostridia bacterium]|nr:phage tail protein [Clostridia bacterium]